MHAIFLDLSKAFDRVWHDGLIYKLKVNDISGNILQLLQNFLKDRKQRVVLNGKSSKWKSISAGVPQGSFLGPLFFLIYINDIISNVTCGIKLYADDTPLFSVVDDENVTACVSNRDLEKINLWAWKWKMQFNANKMEEVIFSCKRHKINHPKLRLGNDEIASKNEHKHLRLILDSKLDLKSRIRDTILKAHKGIGIIKCLSNYVCREVLEQMYKLHVRPHLDDGDIIYHKHDPEMHLHFTQKLEQTQYSVALAVTGAWRGTSRQRLYDELGWETLYHRRWYRRLCHFHSLCKAKAPDYLYLEIAQQQNLVYNLRNPHCYEQPTGRTIRYSNSYFQNTVSEWNLLDSKV